MSDLKNIFGQPQYVDGLGDVYPIRVSEYEEFVFFANLLRFTKKHFDPEMAEKFTLFELVTSLTLQDESILQSFLYMLKMTTKLDFEFINEDNENFKFVCGKAVLCNDNYDQFRDVVMKQNLIYESKVFKSKAVKEWADKVLAARAKNSVDMTMEDMVSVIHVFTGNPYEKIAEYTIYQLQHTFQRIMKVEDYHKAIQYMCAGDTDTKPSPFMEKINLYKNPYDDVFKKKDKLSSLDQAMK